jgi:hypothetical protein
MSHGRAVRLDRVTPSMVVPAQLLDHSSCWCGNGGLVVVVSSLSWWSCRDGHVVVVLLWCGPYEWGDHVVMQVSWLW